MTYKEIEEMANETIEQMTEKGMTLEEAIETTSKVREKLYRIKCRITLRQILEKK